MNILTVRIRISVCSLWNRNKIYIEFRVIFQARGFSAQASQKFASTKANELQVTTLTNNILVASIDQNAPLANVAVVYG